MNPIPLVHYADMAKRKQKKKLRPNKIREWRKKQGLSQEALAARIDVSQTTVQRYEAEGIDIPTSRLYALAEALACSIADLGLQEPDMASEIAAEAKELPPEDQKQVLRLIKGLKAA